MVCSSYSGETEEVVGVYDQARSRGCRLAVIASGGALLERALRDDTPHYHIEPTHNPSGQPRMAVGYSLMGTIGLLERAGLLSLEREEAVRAAREMRGVVEECEDGGCGAADAAQHLHGRVGVLVAAEHLVGAVHTTNNQLNENAKALCADHALPELNHHLLEGLAHPSTNPDHLAFVVFASERYRPRNQHRLELTAEIVEDAGIPVFTRTVRGGSRLSEALSLIQFGAYASVYLAGLYGQDPAPIPTVDAFKRRLSLAAA